MVPGKGLSWGGASLTPPRRGIANRVTVIVSDAHPRRRAVSSGVAEGRGARGGRLRRGGAAAPARDQVGALTNADQGRRDHDVFDSIFGVSLVVE